MFKVIEGEPFSAEISGIDIARPDMALAEKLKALLTKHRVLVFRNVNLSPHDQVDFLGLFGHVATEAVGEAAKQDPTKLFGKVSFVTTKPNEYISGDQEIVFHADFSFYSDGPARVISLHAVEVDAEDPTIFADMGRATQRMPKALLEKLRSLNLVKCSNHLVDNIWPSRMSNRSPDAFYGNTASIQPAVLRHPVSGEEVINICQEFTSHVCGWSDAESDGLFAEVARFQYDAANLYRHRWRRGDLVVWDNFVLQHARESLTPGVTRHFQRVLVHPWDAEELDQRTARAFAKSMSSALSRRRIAS